MAKDQIELAQKAICAKYRTGWHSAPEQKIAGVARNLRSPALPVHGLRHPPTENTTGWFIWAGEGGPSSDPDFFISLHVEHLVEWRPEVLKFLGLPPGWRFLTDGHHEDAWEDPALLDV
jgi:hypothetical protein